MSSMHKAPSLSEKLNLNTATATEIHGLPRMSAGSVNAVMQARTKPKFKDWNDLVSPRVLPLYLQDAIRDLVTF